MLSVTSQKSGGVSSPTLSYPDSVLEKGEREHHCALLCLLQGSALSSGASCEALVLAEVSQRIMTTEKLEIVWNP